MKKNKLRILLIAPRYTNSDKAQYRYMFPLGLAYISAALKKANYDVSCLNLNHHNGLIREIIKRELDKKRYDVVATGHVGLGYLIVENILKTVKEHVSKPKTILGGVIITSEPDLMFKELKPDFGVLGEGEDTILELLKCIERKKDFKKVNGIMYCDNEGNLITTSPRKPIKDIDSIPFPDCAGFEYEKKIENAASNSETSAVFDDYPRVYSIIGSRGCPFNCTFCYHSLGRQYRKRSIKNMMKELELAVEKYKISSISIYDDLFSSELERIHEFCREIKKLSIKSNRKLRWNCQLSVIHINRNILRTMKDAGCVSISYGLESYNQKVLNSMKKPITPKQIDNAIKMAFEEKMGVNGFFIFGDVAETTQTAKETLDYWKNNCKEQITLGFIQPYPGSEIYNHCLRKGIIKDKLDFIKNKMSDMSQQNFINMTDNMTDKEFLELKETVIKLTSGLKNVVKSISVKHEEKDRYEILSQCSFCNEKNLHKNFRLQNKYFYISSIVCKKCNMRYGLISPLIHILMKLNLYYSSLEVYKMLTKRKII